MSLSSFKLCFFSQQSSFYKITFNSIVPCLVVLYQHIVPQSRTLVITYKSSIYNKVMFNCFLCIELFLYHNFITRKNLGINCRLSMHYISIFSHLLYLINEKLTLKVLRLRIIFFQKEGIRSFRGKGLHTRHTSKEKPSLPVFRK